MYRVVISFAVFGLAAASCLYSYDYETDGNWGCPCIDGYRCGPSGYCVSETSGDLGAQCETNTDCFQGYEPHTIVCLNEFQGGYCGTRQCGSSTDCPYTAGCFTSYGGVNFCMRTCNTNEDCNEQRESPNEAICDPNAVHVEGMDLKACVAPEA